MEVIELSPSHGPSDSWCHGLTAVSHEVGDHKQFGGFLLVGPVFNAEMPGNGWDFFYNTDVICFDDASS